MWPVCLFMCLTDHNESDNDNAHGNDNQLSTVLSVLLWLRWGNSEWYSQIMGTICEIQQLVELTSDILP